MKVLIPLLVMLSSVALTTAHHEEELFAQMEELLGDPISWLERMVRDSILNEDATAFKPQVMGALIVIEPQICYTETKKCDTDESWLLGCNCKERISEMGECKTKPCELFRHFRENGAASLSRFVNANTYEEKYKALVDYVIVPVSRAFCDCPDMINAWINCARKYDGSFFQITGMDRTTFDNLVSHLDWKTLKSVLLSVVKAGCVEMGGQDCVQDLANHYTLLGTIRDNTLRGDTGCLSMVRISEEVVKLEQVMRSFNSRTDTLKSFLKRLVDAYLEVEKVATCDPVCAGEIRDNFYSCCTEHSWDMMTSRPMRKNLQRLLRNVLGLFREDGSGPKLTNAVNKYLDMYDPASFCGDKTDVFKVKKEQCDAMES